jgi:hypothetical protein
MSLRQWIETLDNFRARCQRCNRKIRNGVRCKLCGAALCSESCWEKHANAVHRTAEQARAQKAQQKAVLDEAARLEKKLDAIERELPKVGCLVGLLLLALIMVPPIWLAVQRNQTQAEADRLYEEGRVGEAVVRHKVVWSSAGKDKPRLLVRIVEFEVSRGDSAEARRWVEEGVRHILEVTYTSPAAKAMHEKAKKKAEGG